MLMLKINGLIAWMSWTNWIGMIFTEPTSIVPLKLSCVLFISNFSIGLFAQTNSLHKIGRFDSPNCSFCKKFPETLLHLFCQCEKVSPLWDDLCFLINSISEESFTFSVFEKMFGVTDTSEHDNCISYLFLCLKYYIHRCKFQESDLSFVAFMNLVKTKRNIEYKIAVSKGKLRKHFKKWTLDLDAS